MPHIVQREIRGRNILKGDRVLIPGTETLTSPIVEKSVKNKYVWIDGEDGTKGRIGVDDKVMVHRSEPTEAEVAAELRAKTVAYLGRRIAQFEADYTAAREAFTEKMNSPWGPDHWDFEKLAAETAEYRIWAKIDRTWTAIKDNLTNKLTLRDVVQQAVNEFAYDILRNDRRLSKSTSEWSNVIDDTAFTVKQAFIRDLVGYRTDLEVSVDTRNRYL